MTLYCHRKLKALGEEIVIVNRALSIAVFYVTLLLISQDTLFWTMIVNAGTNVINLDSMQSKLKCEEVVTNRLVHPHTSTHTQTYTLWSLSYLFFLLLKPIYKKNLSSLYQQHNTSILHHSFYIYRRIIKYEKFIVIVYVVLLSCNVFCMYLSRGFLFNARYFVDYLFFT